MTPHEVVKESVEKLDKYLEKMEMDGFKIDEYLIKSNLSLLISVKEMVDNAEHLETGIVDINYLQSLLDTEINKIKEL